MDLTGSRTTAGRLMSTAGPPDGTAGGGCLQGEGFLQPRPPGAPGLPPTVSRRPTGRVDPFPPGREHVHRSSTRAIYGDVVKVGAWRSATSWSANSNTWVTAAASVSWAAEFGSLYQAVRDGGTLLMSSAHRLTAAGGWPG